MQVPAEGGVAGSASAIGKKIMTVALAVRYRVEAIKAYEVTVSLFSSFNSNSLVMAQIHAV